MVLLYNNVTQYPYPSLRKWIWDFLTDRKQWAMINNTISTAITTNSGAPQGCVSSPALFSVCTSDCTSTVQSVLCEKFGLKINTKKTEVLYHPTSTRTREEDITVDGNKLNSVQVMDALTMKHRGGWPRLVHLSADYARDSGTTTMCPCGLKARSTVQSCCTPSYTEPRPGQCTDDR